MQTVTYTPTDSYGTTTIDGEGAVAFRWWAGPALGPLPDERPPRFPRRMEWEGRADGGWLALGEVSAYGPCGCCNTRPCLPQCPLQASPPRVPNFWEIRWWAVAQEMKGRGQDVAPHYRGEQNGVPARAQRGGGTDGGQAG